MSNATPSHGWSWGSHGLGLPGVAVASSIGEIIAFTTCMILLAKRQVVSVGDIVKVPSINSLKSIMTGGAAVQVK